MNIQLKPTTVVVVDDDANDQLLTGNALIEANLTSNVRFISDGEELMDYLYRRGEFSGLSAEPHPSLILLDLNMPKKGGLQVLKEVKADPDLRQIPIIILTTSQAQNDILQSYKLGASSFIVKPVAFSELVGVVKSLTKYWFEFVILPSKT